MKRNPTIILFILGALTTISPFSIDMYLPAFTQIADHFHTMPERVSLSLSSYFIGLAAGQIFYGPFLDRFGRKPPLYIGLLLYILSSLACISAPSVEWLIGFRLFQAIGGCVAGVASTAMVRDFFPVEESAQVFSKLMLILSVSPLFAPTVGSFVATTFGWQGIFMSLAIIVILITVVVFFFLPEGHKPDPTIRLDPASIFKSLAEIFENSQFAIYSLAGAFSFGGLFGYLAGSSAMFMGTFHLSAKIFGLIFAMLSIGVVGGGQVNISLMRWFRSQQIFRAAITSQLVIASFFLATQFVFHLALAGHIIVLFLYLACVGLTYPNAAAIALAPFKRNAGSAAALLGFIQMVVGAISSASFGGLASLGSHPSLSISIVFFVTSVVGVAILAIATFIQQSRLK